MQRSLVLRPARLQLPDPRAPHGRRAAALPAARRRPCQLRTAWRTVTMVATAEAAGPISKEDFDETHPPAFYLPEDGRAELEALADVVLVVQGKRLPAHSTVLSVQSRALRSMFVDLKSGSESEETAGLHPTPDGQPVLEEPFQGATVFEAALFLRFCYQPRDLTYINLTALLSSLPGLLRLAHKLDAPLIQQAVIEHMAGLAEYTDWLSMIEWVAAADHCQLLDLRWSLLTNVACHLVSGPGSAFVYATNVVEAIRKSEWSPALQADLLKAMALAARRAESNDSFEWVLERYSQRPSAVGEKVESPRFWAAGQRWHFVVYPGGKDEEAAGHLSVYLECKSKCTHAKYTVTLVDQGQVFGAQNTLVRSGEEKVSPGSPVAWSDFISHEDLHSTPGYLAGDRLILMATVEQVRRRR